MLPSNLTDCTTQLLACVNSSTLLAIGLGSLRMPPQTGYPISARPRCGWLVQVQHYGDLSSPYHWSGGAVSSKLTERRCEARAVGYRSRWATIRSPWQANITRRARDSRVCGLALAAEMGYPGAGRYRPNARICPCPSTESHGGGLGADSRAPRFPCHHLYAAVSRFSQTALKMSEP